jgi:hypothetical protein
MAVLSLPPVPYLEECFSLDRDVGVLTWKVRPLSHFCDSRVCNIWNTKYAGKMAGCVNRNGYISVALDKGLYQAHRIIHKMLTGEDYTGQLDHKDTCRTNNHPDNIRKATQSQNMANTTKDEGQYKYRGVAQAKISPNYRAQIKVDKVKLHIGAWPTPESAHAAYCLAAMHFKKEFANFGEGSCFPTFPLTLEFVKKARFYIEKAEQKLAGRKSGSVNL